MYVNVLAACMQAYFMNSWCLWKSEQVVRFTGTGVMESCESP